jgi:hypothetical protein
MQVQSQNLHNAKQSGISTTVMIHNQFDSYSKAHNRLLQYRKYIMAPDLAAQVVEVIQVEGGE